jgi:hypothetical protein
MGRKIAVSTCFVLLAAVMDGAPGAILNCDAGGR